MNIIEENPQDIIQIISQGSYELAEEKLRNVLARDTRIFDAWHLLGIVQLKTRRIEEAIDSISKAIALFQRFPAALCNLSACYLKKNEYQTAIKWAKKALKVDSQFAQAWSCLAFAQLHLKKINEASISLKKGLKCSPDYPDLLNGMGLSLALKNDHNAAISYYKKAIKNIPIESGVNLSVSLIRLHRYGEALDHIEQVLSLSKNHHQALIAKGFVFYEMGRFQEALHVYQHICDLYPDQSNTKNNMGMMLLLLGDYHHGLELFEHRKKIEQFITQNKKMHTPLWQGENIDGKTLLVCCEQGYGDTIHFLRYVDYFKSYHCKIILSLQLELHCLFKDLGFSLTCPEWKTPDHDLHVFLMSLPRIFKTDLFKMPTPISIPNVHLRPVKNRIGIAWKGNPKHERDKIRSIDIRLFQPLFNVPETHYVSLQHDATPVESKFLDKHKVELLHLRTFTDTLCALETCEHVICVDSAIAHLSGSMGIPTWVLLPFAPDWRWLLGRSDSPWYPSVRLFRQILQGRWDEPMQEISQLLVNAQTSPTVGL